MALLVLNNRAQGATKDISIVMNGGKSIKCIQQFLTELLNDPFLTNIGPFKEPKAGSWLLSWKS